MRPSAVWPFIVALTLAPGGVASGDAASLDELLAEYRSLALPLAPPGARPVVLDSKWRSIDRAGKPVQLVHLALRPADARDPRAPVLLGTTWHTPGGATSPPVAADPGPLPWGRLRACQAPRFFEINAGLATAIQCHALGMTELARRLLAEALQQDCGHHFSAFFQPAGLDAREALARLAWTHWGDELTRPGSDRAAIATRMKALLARRSSLDTPGNRALLRSLDLAIAARRPAAGPIEALAHDLAELANPAPDAPRVADDDPQPPERARILALGFAAVPTLIRLLDDERLTRFVSVGFNNFPPWILRVQHVAGTLLQELAGEDLGKDWLRSLQGSAVTKEAAAAWWMRARAAGEETWLRGHVLPTEPQGEWPNRTMLDLLAARYPHRLAEVYRAVLAERPHVQSWPIVAAIVRSGLDTRAKTELLLLGAGHDRLEHRRAALWKLKELDPGRFRSVLMATLQATPRTPATPYWSCREAAFAHLVIETADDAAWRTLLETARRVDVGLRLELLAPMAYAGKPHRERRVAFLAAFLDDPALRDAARDPVRFTGPFAAFTFPRITVRDFAATQLAAILDLPGERPDAGWSASQWAAFRGRVRALLEARPRTAPAP